MSHPPQPPGPPNDPWYPTGQVPPVSGQPYGPPTRPGMPLPPPGVPRKRDNRTLIAVVVGAAVVLLFMCCAGLYVIGSQEQEDAASPLATPTVAAGQPQPEVTSEAPAGVTSESAAPSSTSASVVKTVVMPKVTGENASVADDKLRKLGFTNIQYGSQDEDDKVVLLLTNWTVAKQSTKAGAKVKTDTLIVLTCTKEG